MESEIGVILPRYSVRGDVLGFYVQVTHEGLHKSRVIKASDEDIVESMAELQARQWDEKWEELETKRLAKDEKTAWRSKVDEDKKTAEDRTTEAQEYLDSLNGLLSRSLAVDDAIDWDTLKSTKEFPEPKPKKGEIPDAPTMESFRDEPKKSDEAYIPAIGIFDAIFGGKKRKIEQAGEKLKSDHIQWVLDKESLEKAFRDSTEEFKSKCAEIEKKHLSDMSQWELKNQEYLKAQGETNASIEASKQKYLSGNADAIIDYCDLVLNASEYPDCFPKVFDLEYTPDTKTLLIEYQIPYINDLPKLKEVKYIQSREEFQEKEISQAELNRLFDEVIYQTALRTLHEIFESDVINAIDGIVFNGRVKFIDPSLGHETSACIISIQASRDEFLAINLANVEAKACFKTLKGVASSKLHGISPIAPIMNMRREDGRFVSAQEIANSINDSTNLAAMDWQDFEHLIREIFEKEFSVNGGEVKITQASRDGGVDAIAFDPDPIRGGKIVIQAKRYTNTVTVSAVRDLFGTVHNEGATKGILVTTSDYGPDAYSFIKGKPLVLLNGANLLHLLEKHGHKARIDIQEAKLMNG
jgi:restriction system protein